MADQDPVARINRRVVHVVDLGVASSAGSGRVDGVGEAGGPVERELFDGFQLQVRYHQPTTRRVTLRVTIDGEAIPRLTAASQAIMHGTAVAIPRNRLGGTLRRDTVRSGVPGRPAAEHAGRPADAPDPRQRPRQPARAVPAARKPRLFHTGDQPRQPGRARRPGRRPPLELDGFARHEAAACSASSWETPACARNPARSTTSSACATGFRWPCASPRSTPPTGHTRRCPGSPHSCPTRAGDWTFCLSPGIHFVRCARCWTPPTARYRGSPAAVPATVRAPRHTAPWNPPRRWPARAPSRPRPS